MNRDIQIADPMHFRGLRKLGASMLTAFTLHVGFIVYFGLAFASAQEDIRNGTFNGHVGHPAAFPIATLIALFLLGSLFYCLLCAARFVRRARVPLPGDTALLLLLLLYGISLPLVQARLNRALANDA